MIVPASKVGYENVQQGFLPGAHHLHTHKSKLRIGMLNDLLAQRLLQSAPKKCQHDLCHDQAIKIQQGFLPCYGHHLHQSLQR